MTPRRFGIVLALFGHQRLIETAYSLRNELRLRRLDPQAPRAAARSFPLMVLLHAGLFTLPLLETARRGSQRVPRLIQALGWSGALTAVALRIWVMASLRDQWNVRAVVPAGLRVVDDGPYRWVRHPNYTAVALEFASLPLIGGAYASALGLSLLNGLLLWDRIRAEEQLLNAHLEYRERMARKPRFLPRWRELTSPGAR